MDNIIAIPRTNSALSKLEEEYNNFKGGQYEKAVSEAVFSTIMHFAEQNNEFAKAVAMTKRSFSDVVYEAMKEWSKSNAKSVSDIDVYRAVVKNYYPNAEVRFLMTLELGEEPTEDELNRETVKEVAKPKSKAVVKPKINEEPAKPMTEVEKIAAEIKRRKEEKDRAIKKALEEEKRRNAETGQILLFDLDEFK